MASKKKLALAHAIALFCLAKFSGRKTSRDFVKPGDVFESDLMVVGEVNGTNVRFPIAGKLVVGQPTQSTKGPDYKSLLSAAIGSMTAKKRADFLENTKGDSVGDDQAVSDIEALALRLSTRLDKNGPISFVEA